MFPSAFVLCVLMIGIVHTHPTSPRDLDRKWTKLNDCNNFLMGFQEAIEAYRECLVEHLDGLTRHQVWAVWPKGVEACKAIEPWDWFEVERIDEDRRRPPLWFIRPSDGGVESFTSVSVGIDRRDATPERQLQKSIPNAQAHGVGRKFVYDESDEFNFSSIGMLHHVFRDSCFQIDGQTPAELPSFPDPDDIRFNWSIPDIPESYIKFLGQSSPGIPLVDLLWIDGYVFTMKNELDMAGVETGVVFDPKNELDMAGVDSGVVFDSNFRGYLIFDEKRIDAASKICQIAIRSRDFMRYALNITLPAGVMASPYPTLPFTKICQHNKRIDLLTILRRLVLTNPSFVPIRSEYYQTENYESYLSEFYINIANSKCVAKYLAKRMEVEKCETQVIEKGKVKNDRFELESEVIMIEG